MPRSRPLTFSVFFLRLAFFPLFLSLAFFSQAATPLTDVQLSGANNQVKSGANLTVKNGGTFTYEAGASLGGSLSEFRADLGLAIGTNVQAYDADLTTWATISPSANVQSLLGAPTTAAFKSALGFTYADIHNTLAPVFNVKTDYGAACDGTTDDTTAVTNAIAAAVSAGGGTVYFPGLCKVSSTITISSSVGIRLLGGERNTCGLKGSSQSLVALLNITGSNVTVENMKLDGVYTSGPSSGGSAIVSFTNSDDSALRNCRVENSLRDGVHIIGSSKRVRIEDCRIKNCYLSIYVLTDEGSNTAPCDITISKNELIDNWSHDGDAQTGGIKFSGHAVTVESTGHMIADNIIQNCGALSIEFWGGNGIISHSTVVSNRILTTSSGDTMGISLNGCHYVSAIGNVIRMHSGYIGIEIANKGQHVTVVGNEINMYQANGSTRTTGGGIVADHNVDVPAYWTTIANNSIAGAGTGITIQDSPHSDVIGNTIRDCETLVFLQNVSYVNLKANTLAGPCSTHVFIDGVAQDVTDIEVAYNTFTGDATYRNVFAYNNDTTHTLSNFLFHHNNAMSCTVSGYDSWNLAYDSAELTNVRRFDNYYVSGTGKTAWPEFHSADLDVVSDAPAYDPSLQQYSIPIAKKFSFTVPANTGDTWYKIFYADYGLPLSLFLHIEANFLDSADNKANSITAFISASPYDGNCGVMQLPDGNYNGGVIKGIRYNNVSGPYQEIWLRIAPTAGGTVYVGGADFPTRWIPSPTRVTVEPTWGANSYELDCLTDHATLKTRYLSSEVWSGFEQALSPSAPSANHFKVYAKDNGSGKTALYVLFPTGAEQQIAVEP